MHECLDCYKVDEPFLEKEYTPTGDGRSVYTNSFLVCRYCGSENIIDWDEDELPVEPDEDAWWNWSTSKAEEADDSHELVAKSRMQPDRDFLDHWKYGGER